MFVQMVALAVQIEIMDGIRQANDISTNIFIWGGARIYVRQNWPAKKFIEYEVINGRKESQGTVLLIKTFTLINLKIKITKKKPNYSNVKYFVDIYNCAVK